jgi:hypothetical protein
MAAIDNNGHCCPRCRSRGYHGTMVIAWWTGESSCLNCGFWDYGRNGHGNGHHRPTALPSQTAPPLVKVEEPQDNTPLFKAFTQFLEECAASNGGCEQCKARRKCEALYQQGCLLEEQGRFNVSRYRIFRQKAKNLPKTS